MTPETRAILANLGASFLLLLAFLALCVAIVVLYLVWRGLRMGRQVGPTYMAQVVAYVRTAEYEARDVSESGLRPQIRMVSAWAGAKAAARALVRGPGAVELPAGEDRAPQV